MSGKNIRFHLSKPYEQCIDLLQKHSQHNRGDSPGIKVSNLETAPHRSSAAVSWDDTGMVRTEGKVILAPENELTTVVQVEIVIKIYRRYVWSNLFTAIVVFISLLFTNQNAPIWGLLLIVLGAFIIISLVYETYIQLQKRSKIKQLDDYLASVTFDVFGVHYAPEMTKQRKKKQKSL